MTNNHQAPSSQSLILAAEDDNLTGTILVRILEKSGYKIVLATDGQQALDIFEELQPDLVLLDAMMPEMDGFTACQRLKQMPGGEDTPVLMVTALQDKESVEKAFEVGASDYIYKPVNWTVMLHRINRLIQARYDWQALQASEERFRQVVASISDHIYVTEITATGMLKNNYISPNIEKLVGYLPERLLEDWRFWPHQLIHPEDQPVARQQLDSLLAGETSELEYRVRTAAGKVIWVRDSARVEHVKGKTFIYGVVSDVTERKRAEESIRHSQKLAELGTLAAGVAHEINSPLQVITGVSEGLMKRHQEERLTPEFLCRKLEVIHRNGWRCAEIVRSLKTYAYTAPVKMELHNLNEIVQDTLLLIEHQLNSWDSISVATHLAKDLPSLHCDRNQITQILINLLTNARDAMPEGGRITITTRYNPAAEQLDLRVADTGHGIPAAIQVKIFDPFYTTKPVNKGTGLGLSIITGLIKAHGGQITVNSAPDAGAEFVMTFPLAPPPAAETLSEAMSIIGRFDDLTFSGNPLNGASKAGLPTPATHTTII